MGPRSSAAERGVRSGGPDPRPHVHVAILTDRDRGPCRTWSGRGDLNPRPPAPKAGALPSCATSRRVPTIRRRRVRSPDASRAGEGARFQELRSEPVDLQGDFWRRRGSSSCADSGGAASRAWCRDHRCVERRRGRWSPAARRSRPQHDRRDPRSARAPAWRPGGRRSGSRTPTRTPTTPAVAASGATWTTIDFDWNHIQSDGPDVVAVERRDRPGGAQRRVRTGSRSSRSPAYTPDVGAPRPTARRASCTASRRTPPTTDGSSVRPRRATDRARPTRGCAARSTVWSLWNEPNHQPFSMPKPDPDKYAAMVKSAYPAVKAVDPTATVLTGGTVAGARRARRQRLPADDVARGCCTTAAPAATSTASRTTRTRSRRTRSRPHDWNAYTQTQIALRRDGRPRRRREEGVGHRDGRADRHRAEGAVRGAAGAVGARLLHRVEHDVPVVHRSARDVPPARQQQRPCRTSSDNFGLHAPRPHAEAGVRARSRT